MKTAFLVFACLIGASYGQCPAGFVTDTTGPCLPGLGCPAGTCFGGGCTDAAQTCDCCTAAPAVTTTSTTTTTAVGVTVTGTGSTTGCIGPCFDNTCPTGFTCNIATQECCSSACIGPCFDNTCPTSYTCNTTTQLCCSSATTTSATNTTCADRIGPRGYSDCPARQFLCNNTLYYTLMTQECPRTCGRCSTTNTTAVTGTCVDLSRANGTSDCANVAYLCNVTAYYTLMTQQCPRTCGRCNSTTTTG